MNEKLDDFRAQWQDKARGGDTCRIYANDAGGEYPIHGAILASDGRWVQQTWTANGKYRIGLDEHSYDLLPIEKRDRVIYRFGDYIKITEAVYARREWGDAAAGVTEGIVADGFCCFLSDFEEWLKTREEK